MQQESELQTFLPKFSFESDTNTVVGTTGTSQGHFPIRTKVEYWTPSLDSLCFIVIKRRKTFFIFGPNDTIQQAAERAVANYPVGSENPKFNEVHVFFKDSMKEIQVTDVHSNVHSMFTADDTMIISNTPRIFKIESNKVIRWVFRLIFFCFMAFGILGAVVSQSK